MAVAQSFDRDRVMAGSSFVLIFRFKMNFQRESIGVSVGGFLGAAADSLPLQNTTFDPLLADDLCERVATRDTVDETKCVANVALTRGVRANENRQGPKLKRSVSKVLERNEPKPLECRPRLLKHLLRRDCTLRRATK